MRQQEHHKATGFRPPIRWVAFASAALTAALVTQVYALGLGKLEVKSALDEPLRAEIELQPGAPGELETLTLGLGSAADFVRANVTRSDQVEGLEFSITRKATAPVIVITTKQPYSEPYLHFLLLAQWSGGKMIREYTALLDPPLYVARLPASTRVAGAARAMQRTTAPEPVVVTPIPEKQQAPRANRLSEARRFGEYGPTEPGDTLWNIALDLRNNSTDLDLFQIMAALFGENPDSFLGANMHRLKVGETLRLEDLDAVAEIPSDGARLLYDTHLAEWNRALGVMLPALPGGDAPAATDEIESVSVAAPDVPVAPVLVYKGLTERVEIIEGRVIRNSERLSELEATLALVQASLTREQSLTKPAIGDATDNAAKTAAPMPEQTSSQPPQVPEVAVQGATERIAEPPSAETPAVDLSQDVAPAVESDVNSDLVSAISKLGPVEGSGSEPVEPNRRAGTTQVVQSPAVPRIGEGASVTQIVNAAMEGHSKTLERADMQAPAPSADTADGSRPAAEFGWSEFTDSVSLGFNWFTAGLIGALLLLLGSLFFMRQRRLAMDFQQSLFLGQKTDSATENADDSITVGTDDLAIRTGTFASTLRDFEIPGMVSVQTDKVDALAEAEIYMAYGRDEQAEGVLKEALADFPDRSELKLKLLEIYNKQKDVTSFEALAEDLYTSAGQHDPALWQKVVAMGWQLNPNNLLFANDQESEDEALAPTAVEHETDGDQAPNVEHETEGDQAPNKVPFLEPEIEDELHNGRAQPGADSGAVPAFGEISTGITQDDEPEPLAQADLYLAYGHVDQAASILKEAVAATPADRSLKLKLLEVHAQRQDREAFDELAEDLMTAGNGADRKHIDSLRETLGQLAESEPEVAVEQASTADYDLGLDDLVDGEAAADSIFDAQAGGDVLDEAEFLTDRIASLEQDLASREQENSELQDRLETLEGQTSGIVAPQDDDTGGIDFDDQIEICEPAVGLLRPDRTAGGSPIDMLQQQVTALEEALQARDAENQALRDRVESLERKVSEIVEQLREIGIDIDSAEDIRTQALKLREIGGAV